MHKRNLDNKTLDTIGRKLIESEYSHPVDIDKIVSGPNLFELVTAKIAEGERSQPLSQTKGLFVFQYLSRNAMVLASAAVLLAGAIGLAAILRPGNSLHEVSIIQVPDTGPDAARPEVPSDPFVGKLSAGRASNRETQTENHREKRVSKNIERKRPVGVSPEPEGEFYAISTAYEPDEIGGNGRIIRVDMARSTLFAMGANIPLENGPDVVKADLLVGPDGVTRAIRVIK